jgi:hypothetical protein
MLELESVEKLTRDLADASKTLSHKEARYLVDLYYQMQDNRIRSYGQVRALSEAEEPHEVIAWAATQSETLENQIKRALDKYTDEEPAGVWAKSNCGIGPVLSAGLCANIGDASRFASCGDLWAYCGQVPGQKRKRGEKANWSSSLKRLTWLIGESFVKVSSKENAFYGHLYKSKKEYYMRKNEAGDYAERAAQCLIEKKYGKETDAFKHYSSGKLPPAHIQSMSQRYAAKIFLSHFWEVSLRIKGIEPPKFYAIAVMGHAHEIKPRHG